MITRYQHSSSQIIVDCVEDAEGNEREFEYEIVDDHYMIFLRQDRSKAMASVNGKLLYEGPIYPGMMRLAAPGEQVRVVQFAPSKVVTLKIPGSLLRGTLQRVQITHRSGSVSFIEPLLQPSMEVAHLGRMLLEHQKFDPAHASIFIHGVTETLLAYLLRNHGRSLRASPPMAVGLTTEELQRAVDFADAQMGSALSLDDWAAALRMPTEEFRRRFRIATGCAPYAWYMQWRIKRAKELLRSGNVTLCQVALRVGFYSQSHFTDVFRRQTGTSPARWQSQMTPAKQPVK